VPLPCTVPRKRRSRRPSNVEMAPNESSTRIQGRLLHLTISSRPLTMPTFMLRTSVIPPPLVHTIKVFSLEAVFSTCGERPSMTMLSFHLFSSFFSSALLRRFCYCRIGASAVCVTERWRLMGGGWWRFYLFIYGCIAQFHTVVWTVPLFFRCSAAFSFMGLRRSILQSSILRHAASFHSSTDRLAIRRHVPVGYSSGQCYLCFQPCLGT